MGTWLVKHPRYNAMKYLGTFERGNKVYYKAAYTVKCFNGRYIGKDMLTKELLKSECVLICKPGPKEMKVRLFLARLFMFETRYWDWQETYQNKFR